MRKEFLQAYRISIVFILCLAVGLKVFNTALYSHVHVQKDGSIVSHAHPLKSGTEKSHSHTNSECSILEALDIMFAVVFVAIFVIIGFVQLITVRYSNLKEIFRKQGITSLRAPPVLA